MTPRLLPVFSALIMVTACGSDKLTPKTAEALIRPDYPVIVPVKVPRHAQADKGSSKLVEIEAINAQLTQTGWFKVQRREEGATVHFEYQPTGPSSIKATSAGFDAPAAEATYVKALKPEGSGNQLRVPYQIRLERPSPLFPLFQKLHPQARLGEVKVRHARIERQGKDWALLDTDEEFKTRN